MNSELLTVSQVAKMLGVHPDTVRKMDKRGELHSFRIGSGKHRRFDKKQIDKIINEAKMWDDSGAEKFGIGD